MGVLHRWLVFGIFPLCLVACDKQPAPAPSSPPSSTAGGRSTASSTTEASSAAAASSVPTVSSGDCDGLKRAVAKALEDVAQCTKDDQCGLRYVALCHVGSLDCNTAHVNKSRSTAPLDRAIKAYKSSCSVVKCKCANPEKSACIKGRCARPD